MRRLILSLLTGSLLCLSVAAVPVAAANKNTPAAPAPLPSVAFASDTSWAVSLADPSVKHHPAPIGQAAIVCVNGWNPYPTGCPSGATNYQDPWGWWGADTSSLPMAWWIWSPDVSSQTSELIEPFIYFSKTVTLDGFAGAATVYLAADNAASISVNGQLVGTVGDMTGIDNPATAYNNLQAFSVPAAALHRGDNTIVVTALNRLNNDGALYTNNPAGVVFGGVVAQTACNGQKDPGNGKDPNGKDPGAGNGVGNGNQCH